MCYETCCEWQQLLSVVERAAGPERQQQHNSKCTHTGLPIEANRINAIGVNQEHIPSLIAIIQLLEPSTQHDLRPARLLALLLWAA